MQREIIFLQRNVFRLISNTGLILFQGETAAAAFLKAAEVENMKKEDSDAADCYEEAAKMFRKINTAGRIPLHSMA